MLHAHLIKDGQSHIRKQLRKFLACELQPLLCKCIVILSLPNTSPLQAVLDTTVSQADLAISTGFVVKVRLSKSRLGGWVFSCDQQWSCWTISQLSVSWQYTQPYLLQLYHTLASFTEQAAGTLHTDISSWSLFHMDSREAIQLVYVVCQSH